MILAIIVCSACLADRGAGCSIINFDAHFAHRTPLPLAQRPPEGGQEHEGLPHFGTGGGRGGAGEDGLPPAGVNLNDLAVYVDGAHPPSHVSPMCASMRTG